MASHDQRSQYRDLDAQFFKNFTPDARFKRFARFTLSPRKLPISTQMRVGSPSGDQIPSPALNYGSRNLNNRLAVHQAIRAKHYVTGYALQKSRMGQYRQYGLRAVHVTAPKSIKA